MEDSIGTKKNQKDGTATLIIYRYVFRCNKRVASNYSSRSTRL